MSRLACLTCAVFLALGATAYAAARHDGSSPASANVARLVGHVPAATLNTIGVGKSAGKQAWFISKLSGAPLKQGGRPEVLAASLAWCPHCAADNWSLAIALSRFGTFHGLGLIDSGTFYGDHFDVTPSFDHTKGIDFYGSHYTSRYVSFDHIQLQTVTGASLQGLSKPEANALYSYDPAHQIPSVNVGGRYGMYGDAYSPGVIAGLSWTQIAGDLAKPGSAVAQHIDGVANVYTAAICAATKGIPSAVCDTPAVKHAAGRL